eukprot:Seg1748.8 transcript_id=Seg1748.8/GoldUCD/mRNA.D3Y31 product="RNA-directed DNA polymerase from mobile element jockey" protein_id=Seg1748.8/GoldUCD/D3Y31
MNNSNSIKCIELRKQRNNKLKELHQLLEQEKHNKIIAEAENINRSGNDSAKMYKAVKILQRKTPKALLIIDTGFGITTNEQTQSEILANFFKNFFNKPTGETTLDVKPCKMKIPFTSEEVKEAISKLKPNKSAGIDSIRAEHLHAAPPQIHNRIAKILNDIAETGQLQLKSKGES